MGGGILKLLIFYNFVIIFLQSFLIFKFNNFLNSSFLESFLHTNKSEIIEFLYTYFDFYIFIILFILVIFCFLIKISFVKKINNNFNILLIIIIVFVVLGNDLRRAFKINFDRYFDIPFVKFHKEILFINDIFITSKMMQESYLNIAKGHKKLQSLENIKNIVLIIGESSRRSAYQDYGQTLPTTPNLMKIQNKIVFSDTIAPYSSTNPVMSVMLNFANLDNLKERKFYENLDIVNLFKLADYKTFWISNQDYIATEFGNNAATIGIMSDYYYFVNQNIKSSDVMNYAKYDEVLLPIIKNIKLDKNNFIIIHLLGNHANYKKRYPKDFSKFNEYDIKENTKDKKSIAEYYNSILYTDYILSQIYEIFKNDDSLILYLSDHAESLYDDKTKSLLGHGVSDKIVAEIPFFIFYSDEFKNKHFNILAKLNKAKDLPFMSDDLVHLFCDIAKIYPKEYEEQRSPLDENFNKNRPRIIANELKYD